MATLLLLGTSSNFASKIVKISSEHGWSKQISEIQQTYSIYQFLHSNLNDFMPFYIYKNSTTVKPGHPSFHFGAYYTSCYIEYHFIRLQTQSFVTVFRLGKNLLFLLISCFLVTWKLSNIIKSLFQVFQLSSITVSFVSTYFF